MSDASSDDDDGIADRIFPGATFADRAEFKRVIALDNAEDARRCYFPENTAESMTARCCDRECDYVVRARARPRGSIEVTSCHVMHTCRFDSKRSPPSSLVEEIARVSLRYNPDANPADVISRGLVDHGYTIAYMQAYRALATIRRTFKTANELSYGLVKPWLQEMQERNPGSIVDFQSDADDHITKAFVMLSSWSQSFLRCLPVLSLDACHLKCKEGGTLFVASALSPNRDIVVVAIGIGMIEDKEHWEWFCRNVRAGSTLHAEPDTVVMSDREKGLDTALETVLPEVPHGYCSFHLKKNVVTNYKTDLKGNVVNLAKALTETEYRDLLAACTLISEEATEFLKADIPGPKWATCFFPRPRFGMATTNISESSNSWLLEEREHTWFSCLATVVRKVSDRMYRKRKEYEKLEGPVVPWVRARVMKNSKIGRTRQVSTSNETLYEVLRHSTPTYATVCLETRDCSCRFWKEHQYPCVHACAAIIEKGEDPMDYVSSYFSTARLQQLFEPFAQPVDVLHVVSDSTKPPIVTKRRGRPKKIRIRNRSEFINDDSPVHCSLCSGRGHNKRTCERRAKKQKQKHRE